MANPRDHVSIRVDTARKHDVAAALERRERTVIVSPKWVVAPRKGHIGNAREADRRRRHERSERDRWETTRWRLGSIYNPLIQRYGKGTPNLAHGDRAVEILADAQAGRLDVNAAAAAVSCARDKEGSHIVG